MFSCLVGTIPFLLELATRPSVCAENLDTSGSISPLRLFPPIDVAPDTSSILDYYAKQDPLLYFLHIPKAAGQSFQTVIQDILEWPTQHFVAAKDSKAILDDMVRHAPDWIGEMRGHNETTSSMRLRNSKSRSTRLREPAFRFDL